MLRKVGKLHGEIVFSHNGELKWEKDHLYLVKLTEAEKEEFMGQDVEINLNEQE